MSEGKIARGPRIIRGALAREDPFSHRKNTHRDREISEGASRAHRLGGASSTESEEERRWRRPSVAAALASADDDGRHLWGPLAFLQRLPSRSSGFDRRQPNIAFATPQRRLRKAGAMLEPAGEPSTKGGGAAADRTKVDRRLTSLPPFGCCCCCCFAVRPSRCPSYVCMGLERRTLRFLLICVMVALECLVKDREGRRGWENKRKKSEEERRRCSSPCFFFLRRSPPPPLRSHFSLFDSCISTRSSAHHPPSSLFLSRLLLAST